MHNLPRVVLASVPALASALVQDRLVVHWRVIEALCTRTPVGNSVSRVWRRLCSHPAARGRIRAT